MPPFLYGLHNNTYYNPEPDPEDTLKWTYGPQPVPHPTEEQAWGLTKFGLGLAAIAGFGQIRFAPDKRGWDYIIGAVRGIEEYSPGRVFRTFQVSHLLSPLETAARQTRYIGPEEIARLRGGPGSIWLDHLERLGVDLGRAGQEGFRFEKGQILRGRTGQEVLLERAGIVRAPTGAGARFQEAYARSLAGAPIPGQEKAFAQAIRFTDEAGRPQKDIFMFTGGKGRLQATGRYLAGYGTALAERINQLARAPFELPVVSGLTKRFPLKYLRLDVTPSSGLRTFGKIVSKLGIGTSAFYLAYRELDYHIRQEEALDDTILAEGLTAGIATAWTRGQVATSRVAEILGLHAYREAQEEIAPGSTELSKLLGFPLLGALGGLFAGYTQNIRRLRGYRKAGLDLGTASRALQAEESLMREFIHGTTMDDTLRASLDRDTLQLARERATERVAGWQGRVSGWFAQKQGKRTVGGALSRLFGKVVPGRVTWMTGAAIGAALISPFVPGALVPSERPEELEAIYSGEQKVAVRRGRYWEFGRCLIISTPCELIDGTWKAAGKVEIGDTLIGRDCQPARVQSIFLREIKEDVYWFSTAYDRHWETGLTSNHIVPVLREGSVLEIPAEEINPNEFVEVPYKPLVTHIKEISSLDFIKYPTFVVNNNIYAAQRNWFTGNLQKSGTTYISKTIELDYDFGLLVGYYLAEGNISFNNKTGNPTFLETVHARHEEWIIDDIGRICREKFNTVITKRYKKGGKSKEGCWIVRICNSVLAKLFQGLFYEEVYDADLKCIPAIFDSAQGSFKKGLIIGYHAGDGHLDGNSRIISSARKWLLDSAQLYSINDDKPCGLSFEDNNKKGKWRLRFASDAPCAAVKFYQGRLFARIRSIRTEYYEGNVVDFEVDHPDHVFKAGTFLVHNSPYEGQRIDRYRAHWYPRMLARAKEKAIWGEDAPSPLKRWWIENMTYELERRHYHERPYPVTGTFGEDIPFIGPLIAATVGRAFKPPALMHTEEWMRGPGTEEGISLVEDAEYRRMPLKYGEKVIPGELEPGAPITPYGTKGTIGEQIYMLTEMVGLPGFTMTAIKEAVTGEADTFAQEMQLESARRMYGAEREYWDLELGGGAGTTELLRRLYPHRRRQIPLYNPIPNALAEVEWLPGAGEKSIDPKTGDPYSKIVEGEMRLPGPGYVALHPELRGVAPADYPLIHRFSILADVFPYTDKFKSHLVEIRQAIANKQLSQEEIALYKETMEQIKARRTRREFTPYKYRERARTPIEEILAAANEREKDQDPSDSWFARAIGSYWETLAHEAETPIEYLTPMSPASKLIHMRTAVEDYERSVWATENAFWGHPIRDFILPTITATAHALGWDSIPGHVQERRDLEEYFDILKYIKYTRLKNTAKVSDDHETVQEYENKRRETLFGINPYTYNFSHIFKALPRRERDYFNEFIKADVEERKEIMSMIPENERALFIARWKLKDAADLKKAIKKDLLTDEQVEQAEALLRQLYKEKDAEGHPKNKELWAEYITTRYPGESYGDWYRRVKLLPEELEGRALPGPDWVGWSPMVDLEDIKLKIVTQEGKNMYDYDLWPDRLRAVARRPMIAEAARALEETFESPAEIRERIDAVLAANNIRPTAVYLTKIDNLGENIVELELEDDRAESSRTMIRRYAHG